MTTDRIPMNPLATTSFSFYSPEMGIAVSTAVSTPKWMPNAEHFAALKPAGIFGKPQYAEEFPYRLAYIARLDSKEDEILRGLTALTHKHPGERLVLMCWCNVAKGEWCHRRMLAEWLEQRDLTVPELARIPKATKTSAPKTPAAPDPERFEPLF